MKACHQITEGVSIKGHVSLVGAGPGDPDLLTIKALKRLQSADIVFYDALVSQQVLDLINSDADLVYVGKKSGNHSTQQIEIEQLLIGAALAGKQVVRLKGGDSFVFGRGGEELEALQQHQITFDVVPGITAAAASAAYTGIPLTHRNYAHSAILVTGHGKGENELDWQALAKTEQTLAIYMGLQKASEIQQQLIANGRAVETPVVIIENATRPEQRTVVGQLNELAHLVTRHQITSPAMILIGEVCSQAGRFHWFGQAPELSERFIKQYVDNQVLVDVQEEHLNVVGF
jgi:uroporphyrin-III C-methyltransferase/precorrin-2 dehydrogenase/sirohydrochlorin ferrochelatase